MGIVVALFVVVAAVSVALSLFLRRSPEYPDTQAPTATIEVTPDPQDTAAAVEPTPPETAVPREGGTTPPGAAPSRPGREYTIVEVLPKNFIPAVNFPYFYDAEEAGDVYDDDELIIGLDLGGERRAYSVPYLSGREIVNDTVGEVKVAVTW